ncbi:M4 family metallopeptidase [Massilia sp. W12]|uniref:M4 family metallopeptidase n=1 Tax=Massilia sp. W12 TaxID=3126507 RepID=UPI0030CD77FA
MNRRHSALPLPLSCLALAILHILTFSQSASAADLVAPADPHASAAKEQQRKHVLAGPQDAKKQALAQQFAREHLQQLLAHKGNAGDDVQVLRSFSDARGRVFVHVQHTQGGIPVWGSQAIVEMESDGMLAHVVDDVKPQVNRGFAKASLQASVTAENANALAQAAAGMSARQMTAPARSDLWLLRDDSGRDRLAWRVALRREDGGKDTTMPVVFIDAHSGATLWKYDNLQTASVAVSGVSNYEGTLSLTGFQSGSTYYLEDVGRKLGTFNYNNTTSSLSRVSSSSADFNSTVHKAAVDAHYGAVKTYDYFKNVHGRNGIDGNGGPGSTMSIDGVTSLIGSRVHYSTRYNNAFWNGSYMTYGDGDGTTFGPLTSLDIAGHEMTHGITERTAGLVYSGESGALNESMSDVFGALVERYAKGESAATWKIGEQVYTPANGTGDALRYMDNPHLASNNGFTADDDPDHYSERYTGTADNGGVHINSGIANKAFHLVAKGGSHHLGGTMTGIGADDAAKIWYKALTTYMTSSTNFAGARSATLNAATALFGATSAQYNAVCNAWNMVGVGASCNVVPNPNPGTDLLSNGGFETAITPWIMSGTGAFYIANGNYPQAGTGYAYFGNANSVTGQTYQQVTLPAGSNLNFSYYLNVSSAETTTTTQYDKLFVEVRDTSGVLLATLATYSNLNKAATGAYSLKSHSLGAYAGRTIRLQFRTTTDSSNITTFRVDTAAVK